MLLACVASVSVRFRSKQRGTKVKMAQGKERPKQRIPYGLSFLRNQTETIAPGGGGGDFHMKQTGMLVGNFEFNP